MSSNKHNSKQRSNRLTNLKHEKTVCIGLQLFSLIVYRQLHLENTRAIGMPPWLKCGDSKIGHARSIISAGARKIVLGAKL